MRNVLLCFLALLLSCATEPVTTKKEERPVPYSLRYKKKDQELIYVVVNLVSNIDPETKKVIKDSIQKFDPELVITKYPAEAAHELGKMSAACEQENRCSTALWTCQQAKKKGIRCISGDPYYSEILKESQKVISGTPDDILFYYTYRSLVAISVKDKNPLGSLESKIELNKELLNMVSDFNSDDFIRIYRSKFNTNSVKIDPKHLAPDSKGNYIQRLSFAVDKAYHNLLFRNIMNKNKIHKRILVVYGHFTFVEQKEALEERFSGHLP